MTKLCFKYEQIEKIVIPQINKTIDYLHKVKNEFKNTYIPYDFKYCNYLKDVDDNIDLLINNLKSLIDKIEIVHRDLNNNINDMEKMLNNI